MTENRFDHLRLDQVSRRFGGRAALEALDLSIAGGEFVALLGPSGCGKSTALNCLAGLLPLSGGSIWLDDRRIDTLPPEKRGFGMVFQNYALFPHLSVRRNVGFGLRMRRVSREETRRRVDEALRMVQLQQYADRLPGQLSGGQQQRVAIARAIVLEPPLVLMDEPLSNLDAALRLEMRTEIRRLHQSLGLTTVYVTHDQEEALSLADRLVILREGVVQQVGTPEELYRGPVNAYVAGFMGYRNLLPVQTDGGQGAVRVTAPGLAVTGTAREAVAGGPAVAAIRPEDFVVTDTGDNLISVDVEVVEYHGREQAVQGRLKGGQVIRLRSVDRLAPGDAVTVAVPADKLLVFAADADALAAAEAAAGGRSASPAAAPAGAAT
ncbi:ABC transporter ATP-binding protein [Planosporangium mesophilum]|uniref:ABC transporter ATP-binding protein n=1 Tax=Planosporangium mesophilum TaxID=689768 RepID=A0A8J3T7Y1_9ACTN|nr:ABC transporter ATP-binding protein [Planosporangium mesophilum]NJC81390.1 ABC transporter ATP-binding protein [Planosporangium mesophilum]GII20957.1 ABC transporter ATP-binding protein [Planosporangium mesophilum]